MIQDQLFLSKKKFSYGRHPCHPSKHLISVSHGGRLGNNMGEYATLWYYSQVLNNVEAFISPNMEQDLKKVFPYISLPAYEIPHSCQREFVSMDAGRDHEKIVTLFERDDSLAFVNLEGYPNAVSLFHTYREDIISEFQFSERLSANVKAFQDQLHSLHCQSHEHCDQLRLVGIHVRRTDYKEWMAVRAKQELVNENFFLSAMGLMVDKIGEMGKQEKLMFVVASDDPMWCKDKFSQFRLNNTIIYTSDHYPILHQKYLEAHNLSGCSNKDCNEEIVLEYVHFDLAVISSMNYNIFDYGTFGMWGAYLSQAEITIGADLRVTNDDLRKFHLKDKLVDAGVEGFMFLQPP